MATKTQKLSSGNDLCEGLSVLTSEQMSSIRRHLEQVKSDRQVKMFDGNLYDAFKIVFRENKPALLAMSDSIHDDRCTKSFYHVQDTYSQFEEFEVPDPVNMLWNVNLRAACAVVKEQLHLKKMCPIQLQNENDLFNVWTNTKASAGLINLGKSKSDSKSEAFQAVKRIKRMIKESYPAEQIQIPAQLFHRAQISNFIVDGKYNGDNIKMKDRLVWGLDAATVAVEGQYAKPLIEYLSKVWFGYAGGKSPEDLRSNIHTAVLRKNEWLSIDYSKFDQTVPSWLIYWCFDVIKSCFDEKYHQELDWIAFNFVNTKLAIPGRGIVSKRKGIPSGSNFTQIIGSMANAIIAFSFIASTSKEREFQAKCDYVRKIVSMRGSSEIPMFVMGDDNLMFTSIELDLEQLSSYAHEVFGMKINPEKCEQGSSLKAPAFLKREWRSFGEYQDPKRLLVNVIHPERKRTYKGYSPWHIIYGLYLTYKCSFPSNVSERWLAEQMEANGGIKALISIPRTALPGVMRAFGDDAIAGMVARAERLVYDSRKTS